MVAAVTPPPPDSAAVLRPLLTDDSRAAPSDGAGPAGAMGPPESAGAADSAARRFRLHRAAWSWLHMAARERPLAVLLDDLHWADAETLALLSAAGSDITRAPILVVAAFRADEADGRLTEMLAALARRSPLRLPLPGLAQAAVQRLVDAVCETPADPAIVTALAERTGGNPFYVQESARLLASEGSLVAMSEVPEGVRDVLRRRVARLPEATIAVLRLAAVAGREADVEVLVSAAETDESGVLDALESGLIAGLLTEPAPGRVRFVHALVPETMLADLSRLRATRMHARIAAALQRLAPEGVSALAYHYSQAATSQTAARAVEYCARAAQLAEQRYAHEVAAEVLSHALECFERIPADPAALIDTVPSANSANPIPVGRGNDRDAERAALLAMMLQAQVRAGALTDARATRSRAIRFAEAAGGRRNERPYRRRGSSHACQAKRRPGFAGARDRNPRQ